VLDRISRAGRGEWAALLEEAREQAAAGVARRAGTAALRGLDGSALAGEVIRRVSLGELGRAAQLLGQAKVAAPCPEVRAELQSLLVTLAEQRGLLAADPDADEEVPARHLAKELRKAPRSSGPGPSGSRFTHWQSCQHSPGAMTALGVVVDRIASGRVPPGAAAGLALTSLTPLRKKNGRLRPVAAGEALRRLTAKALARAHAKPIAEAVGLAQFGVGTPGGTEALSHAVQVEAGRRPQAAFVALDMRNAFPSLDRDEVLAAVGLHAPFLLPYARLFLGRRSRYRYLGADGEGEALPADQGVDQGDPLAPAFLAVTIRRPLERLEARLRELAEEEGFTPDAAADAIRVRAYLDDVLVRVPDTLAARVPAEAAAALAPVGGDLDAAKTQVWRAAGGCPPGCQAWWVPAGLVLLGGPLADEDELTGGATVLGSAGFVEGFLASKLEKFEAFLAGVERTAEEAAPHLPRAQSGNLLLRVCGLGRLTHLTRLLPPAATAAFAAAADGAALATFAKLAGLDDLTPLQEKQARLSQRRGGMGLRSLHERREAAWVGSWLTTLPRVRDSCPAGWAGKAQLTRDGPAWAEEGWAAALLDACDGLAARGAHLDAEGEVCGDAPDDPWSWEDGFAPLRKKQGELSKKLEDAGRRELLQAETCSGRARVRSCGGPGAGAWLSAIPADAGLSFSDEEFMIAARFRLGQHLCLGGQQCGNAYATTGDRHRAGDRCQGVLDAQGLHAATCLVGGRRKRTHDAQRDLYADLLPGGGYAVQREQHVPGWDRWVQRANGRWVLERAILDLRLEAPPAAPVTYLDTVVTHPCAATYLHGAAGEDGFAARLAEEGKHSRYPPDPRVQGRLVPLAVETYGRLGKEGLRFLRKAAGRACTRTTALAVLGGEGPPAVLGSWLERQSVALQKNNAAAFKAAAGAAATWRDLRAPGLEEAALDVLAEAERLAALAA